MFLKKVLFLMLMIGNMMGPLIDTVSASSDSEEEKMKPTNTPPYSDNEDVIIPISSKRNEELVPVEIGCEEAYFRGVDCCWRVSQGWFNGVGAITGYAGAGLTALSTMGNFSDYTQTILGSLAIACTVTSAFCHSMDSYAKERSRNISITRERR